MTTPTEHRLINRALYLCDLPAAVTRLCELVGWSVAMLIVNHYGGTYIQPTRRPQQHDSGTGNADLIHRIGRAAYDILAAEFDGERVYIPKCDYAVRKARNLEINARFLAGETAPELAIAYQLSERWIWDILKDPDTLRANQPDLFG